MVYFSKVTLFTSLSYWLSFSQLAQNVFMWVLRDTLFRRHFQKSFSQPRSITTRWRLSSVKLRYLRTPCLPRTSLSKNTYVESSHSKIWLSRHLETLNSFFLIGLHRRRSIYRTDLVDSDDIFRNSIIKLTLKSMKDTKSIQLFTNVYKFIKWFELYKLSNSFYPESNNLRFTKGSLRAKEISNNSGLTELLFVNVKKFKVSSRRQTYREIITSLSWFMLKGSEVTISKSTTWSPRRHIQNILPQNLHKDPLYQQVRNASNTAFRKKRTWRYHQLPTSIRYSYLGRTRTKAHYQSLGTSKRIRIIKEICFLLIRRTFTALYNRYDSYNLRSDRSLTKSNRTRIYSPNYFRSANNYIRLTLSSVKYFNLAYLVKSLFTTNSKSICDSWAPAMIPILSLSHEFRSQITKVRCFQRLFDHYLFKYFTDTSKLPSQLKLSSFQLFNNSMFMRLSISPKYTLRFKRSLFFFLLIFQNLHRTDINWLMAISKYSPTYTFTLFPSSNNFKLSIFKRLNIQKYLLSTQLDSYKWTSDSMFNTYTMKARTLYNYSLQHLVATSSRDNFTAGQILLGTTYLNTYRGNTSRYIRVRRLRFKPGYARLWRESRSDIKEILEMQVRYQNRLTLKLQKLHRQQRSRLFTYSTATVFFSLMSSQISVDMWSTLELLRSEVIYINGRICTNHFMHLFLHDFLQIIVNIKFYFLLRFIQNRVVFTSARINKIFYRKYRLKNSNLTLRVQRKLPWTFFHLQSGHLDVLPYLEVDYFTLSSFVILDQHVAKTWVPIRAYALELTILNMYNWKYIT